MIIPNVDKVILAGLEVINHAIDLEILMVSHLDDVGKKKWAQKRIDDRELWERFNPFRWLDRLLDKVEEKKEPLPELSQTVQAKKA